MKYQLLHELYVHISTKKCEKLGRDVINNLILYLLRTETKKGTCYIPFESYS
jgi:hypothetical protein